MRNTNITLAPIPQLVVERLASNSGLQPEDAERQMIELAKFLSVCAEYPGENAPSRVIDDLWHVFVLFTREYQRYCQENFGKFIHHTPTGYAMNNTYQKTRARAQEMFGELDQDLWPENAGGAAICNDCCDDNPGGEHPQG
ncbi:MAG: hypothetical protein COU07_02570 [Candidatus Harrisonbacteria bacterium CG10_big_fil_rev_8_21_14_0_10_40_38]|uniref:Uncharacterized protein n=1 Tax=Candidatus Harrisonbacteria bacterium CG10_big_fil_rev_8_21_14_0_10_40_38 TaxID=1974583 RepID=A0A2H0URQ2_9BACT|nr:MAG: hypothetical protein COU07_02570 [Candidatus Harrisonbacteria bacterium CG10_big_fil_rev_8_21_14_0_10_40_38]